MNIENAVNRARWESWRAEQKTEREKTYFYCWSDYPWFRCVFDCVTGDCALAIIEYASGAPMPGGICGFCAIPCAAFYISKNPYLGGACAACFVVVLGNCINQCK